MKLLTYETGGKQEVGVLSDCETKVLPLRELGYHFSDMIDLIEKTTDKDLKEISEKAKQGKDKAILLDSVKKCSPIPYPRQGVICTGLNYLSYAKEAAKIRGEVFQGPRTHPVIFAKRVYEATPDDGEIHYDQEDWGNLVYGVELAVVIKSNVKNVSQEEAMNYVFGYTIVNDVASLNYEFRHTHPDYGKSFDGCLPMGPWITTADEFDRGEPITLSLKVNGELRQKSTTAPVGHSMPSIISDISQGMTLEPGTVISTGTPGDTDLGFEGHAQIKRGDVIECHVEGIGTLKNYVVE